MTVLSTKVNCVSCAHGVVKYVYKVVLGKRSWLAVCIHCTKHRFGHLYENELQSDVVLMIGEDGYQERVPGHSWVLANGSDYFRALFEGPLADESKGIHRFPDNPNGFNNLIKWIYQSRCSFQSLQSSLDTLQVSIKYLCPELADQCIKYTTTQLSVQNVLIVLGWIHCYCAHADCRPSAPALDTFESVDPPLEGLEERSSTLDPTTSCYQLLDQCLRLIDDNTETVLSTESLSTVDPAVLNLILQRESIKMSSELVLVRALYTWSTAACKRKGLPLTTEHRIDVLGRLRFMPRLLTIKPQELQQSTVRPELIALLTEEEYSFVQTTIKGSSEQVVPYSMVNYEISMTQKRQTCLSPCKKHKKRLRRKFNKKDIMIDLVALLAMLFD